MPQGRSKILHAATKTWCSQTDKLKKNFFFKRKQWKIFRDFHRSPEVRTCRLYCRSLGSVPGPVLSCVLSCSVVSDSSATPRTAARQFLCPWNFLGKNTGMGCHFLLQGIFLTQRLNLSFLYNLWTGN